jgi:hypothetical protein
MKLTETYGLFAVLRQSAFAKAGYRCRTYAAPLFGAILARIAWEDIGLIKR